MDQYGEMEEGALDADDIEGTLDEAGERMQQLIRDTQYSIRSGSSLASLADRIRIGSGSREAKIDLRKMLKIRWLELFHGFR